MDYIEETVRPWGRYIVIEEKTNYKIKRIEVKKGHRLSYQFHNKRSETWVIIQGNGQVKLNDLYFNFKKGDTIVIQKGEKHRIENTGNELVIFIEVQTGEYFGEDDIIRIEDDYKRT